MASFSAAAFSVAAFGPTAFDFDSATPPVVVVEVTGGGGPGPDRFTFRNTAPGQLDDDEAILDVIKTFLETRGNSKLRH